MSTATLPTDQAALLASVLAAPKDDAPRLVYADWLDDHGEAERAEFIRVQVELARLKHPDKHYHWRGTADCDGCRAKRLHKRERAILREWIRWPNGAEGTREAWWYEQMAAAGIRLHDLPAYRRGFVTHVELTTATFLGGQCGRCDVSPGIRRYPTYSGDWIEDECNECSGSGRTPGIAAALFSAHPVTEVRLTDREPAEHVSSIDTRTYPHHRPFWFVGPQMGINERERHWIPPEIGRLIVGDTTPGGPNAVYFDFADAARAALSAACVRHGRTLAGVG